MANARSRAMGVGLVLAGLAIIAAGVLAPIPAFDRLERRDGVVTDVRVEDIRFCRRGLGDCVHTVVDVDHAERALSYNFAQTRPSEVVPGEPIAVWVAPAIKGIPVDRVWHAEQGGRVLREHTEQARVDRTIRWVLLGLVPVLLVGGFALARRE